MIIPYHKSCYRKFLGAAAIKEDPRTLILFLMVAVYPLVFSTGKTGMTMSKYIFLAAVSLPALYPVIRDRIKLRTPALIPLGFFILCAAISTVLAANPATAWIGLYRYTGFSTYIFCVIMFLTAAGSDKAEKILGWVVACASVVSMIAVLQYFGLNFLPPRDYNRLNPTYATIGNPNFLATYAVFILPAAMLFYLRKHKPVFLAAAAVIFAALLVTLTRGAWLAFLPLSLVIFYYCRKKQLLKPLGKLYLILFLVTCMLLPVHDWYILKRALSIPDQVAAAVKMEDRGGSNRIKIWKEAIETIEQHWAFGVGPDSFRFQFSETKYTDKAHNIYLEIAATMGMFALLSYLCFLSFFLRPGNNETGFTLFFMILTYLVQGFFNIDAIAVMPLFWIVLGLSLSKTRSRSSPPAPAAS